MTKHRILSLILFAAALAGCAQTPEDPPTAAELYDEATELHNGAKYADADAKFDELASTFPTSSYTQQSLLDRVYYFLQRREYVKAIDSADRFVDLYPNHPQTPYAIYMKGVVYFRENRGLLDVIGQQDPSSRDTRLMQLSFEAFSEVVENYPDSRYAADAADRMRYLINALAKNEVHIADYYYKRGAFLAVVGRAENILRIYPDSTSTEAALILLSDAYGELGAAAAAEDARRLLEINFPQSGYFNRE